MNLIKNFLKANDSSDDEISHFFSKLVQVDFKKNDIILKAGQTENYLSFVEHGLLRFYVEKEDREITFDFAFAGNFTSGYSSFLTRDPSPFFIQALTDTSLWRIAYEDLQGIYKDSEKAQMIGRLAAEQLFIRKAKRELSFLIQSAAERYMHLLQEQPEMVQEIPLKYLASYIGITPQALSRIRKRIS